MKLIGANGLRYVQPDELPLAAVPTSHWAGTREKIEAMRERVERGEAIFHPCDAQRKKSSCGQMQRTKIKVSIDTLKIGDAAKQMNVSPESVKRAKAVKDKGTPGLADMVRDGKVSARIIATSNGCGWNC